MGYYVIVVKCMWENNMQHELDPRAALEYMLAGHGKATLVGAETRYTYKFGKSEDSKLIFVKVLTGSNNETDYTYIGFINPHWEMVAGRKGNAAHGAFKALAWYVYKACNAPEVAAKAQFLHEGVCGKCGRTLTTPESIARGIGPVCWEMM